MLLLRKWLHHGWKSLPQEASLRILILKKSTGSLKSTKVFVAQNTRIHVTVAISFTIYDFRNLYAYAA